MMTIRTIIAVLVLAASFPVHAEKKTVKAEPARAILVFNRTTNTVEVDTNIHKPMAIASLTKLMTAYVVLESRVDLDEPIRVIRQQIETSRVLRPGMIVTRRELLNLALIASDNLAAKMLAVAHPWGYDEFINSMNANAIMLGMHNTKYIEPSGLYPNTSTAWDMHLLNHAVAKYAMFADAAMSKTGTAEAETKPGFLKQFLIKNTSMFAGMYDIQVGKTGYTSPAGWCISMLIRHSGQEFDIVVLGSPSKQARNALTEKQLKNYMNYITRYDMLKKIGVMDSYSSEY